MSETKLLTVREAADMLGISHRTIKYWYQQGVSPFNLRRVGRNGKLYMTEADVRAGIEKMRQLEGKTDAF